MNLKSHCLAEHVGGLHQEISAVLAKADSLTLDASGLREVDASVMQLFVSASRTEGTRFSITGLTDAVRSTFHRAGLDVCPETGALSQL